MYPEGGVMAHNHPLLLWDLEIYVVSTTIRDEHLAHNTLRIEFESDHVIAL